MVKSEECRGNALNNQKILPVKVHYSHCSKFDCFRPAQVRF
jgi:hypothetical protein